ncbi:hypothetical protein [Flavobacterium humidisoli]|uniref:Uncharacterized protein n=1 Tax=Flavobacterium humidisoli TaxID=2937442 RepID=A0ABY4M059_9FLAO|nr:hypothetical protein [Flavobacterium humidisoli]UPZ17849.1 hypothetical protein M0M44_10980 [Flavobacterium humidisoli]
MINVKNKLLKNKLPKNKLPKNKLYGSYYDKLKNFMTEDEWVLKNIYEINYFGHGFGHLYEFKFIDETWFVRPVSDYYRAESHAKQILSYSFAKNRAMAEVLMTFLDEKKVLFEKECALKGINGIHNPFDKKFKLQVCSIIDLFDLS